MNPTAGAKSGQEKCSQLFEMLRSRGYSVEVIHEVAVLEEAARSHLADGTLRAVVAAGGDGTVGMLANQLPPEVPIGILPLGTENLLAKYVEVPSDPSYLSQLIHEGYFAVLDAGVANGRIFTLMAGCGFDAEVVRQLDEARTGNITHWSYVKPIWNSVRRYHFPMLQIECDGDSEYEAAWVFVVNVPKYAGGLGIMPDADPTDGLLDICLFRKGSVFSGCRYLAGIVAGRHHGWKDCTVVQAKRVRVDVLDAADERAEDVPYQLDGDPGGVLPLEIESCPKRLTLLVPQRWIQLRGIRVDSNQDVDRE